MSDPIMTLPEAARLMLRVLDARPARLNAGLALETQLLREAVAAGQPAEVRALAPEVMQKSEARLRHRAGCKCAPDPDDICPGCGRRVA